jgi:hypothetical protein
MRIQDMTDGQLVRALAATEQVLGVNAYEVQVLRRELSARQAKRPHKKREKGGTQPCATGPK